MSATNAINDTGLKYLYDVIDSEKQNKEQGKGLSTEDYTTVEKQKLASIPVWTVNETTHKIVLSEYADGNDISY